MKTYGNLPCLEDIADKEKIVCDEKYHWLRAKRVTDSNFLGCANGHIRAGYCASFIIDLKDKDIGLITESGASRYKNVLPNFYNYILSLGEREYEAARECK